MTKILTLIGDLGSGKTSFGAFLAKCVRYQYPDVPIISNVTIGGATKVSDIHKFLAIKIREQDKKYAFLVDDEAAQSGLESRGSGSKAAAVESRIITLARKAHVDLILISQLKSMLDKRAQWLENNSILCEAYFAPGNLSATPNGFDYTIYNSKLEETGDFSIPTAYYQKYIWPFMDTDDIPFKAALDKQFSDYYAISDRSVDDFRVAMGYEALVREVDDSRTMEWFSRKAFKETESIKLEGSRWSILDRWWDEDALPDDKGRSGAYGYLLRESS